jgi:hypothetical protein
MPIQNFCRLGNPSIGVSDELSLKTLFVFQLVPCRLCL